MVNNRWRAAAIHLLISTAIAIAVSLFIVLVWYPGPLFDAAGGKLLLALVVGVDVCLGPLVTLVIFNPKKRRALLLLDYSVIAALQVSALIYVLYATYEGRPVFVAYGQGYFVAVSANQIDDGMLKAATLPQFKSLPIFGPHWVGTRPPTDPHEQSDLNFNQGVTGMGIHYQPKYYVELPAAGTDVAKDAKPLEQLRKKHSEVASTLDAALAKLGRTNDTVRYLPFKAKQKMLTVLVDAQSGAVLDTLAVDPG